MLGCLSNVRGDQAARKQQRILILKFGQSNSQKRAQSSLLSPGNSAYGGSYANVQEIAQQDNDSAHDPMQWQNLSQQSLGVFSYDGGSGALNCIGFEASMMRDLDAAPASTLIPRGFGGYALATIGVLGASSSKFDPAGSYPTSPPAGPNLYSQIITYAKNAMVAMGCSALVCVWEQGEADAMTTTAGSNYAAWVQGFVDSLRASFGNIGPDGGSVPFVFGRMNADSPGGTYLGLSQLRTSQAALPGARTRCTMVDQDSITQASGMYNGTHYNPDGYVAVGHLYSPKVASYCGVRIQPVASFTDVPTALSVAFTDTSASLGDTITAWHWDFGDSNTSSLQNPTHVYASGGTYNVTLQVTNSAGDTNTTAAIPISVSAITKDATKGWFKPATSSEWTAAYTAMGVTKSAAPRSIRKCNDTTNNGMADVGSANLTLTPTSAPAPDYQIAVPGWADKGVGSTSNTAKRFVSTDPGLPDILTVSQAIFGYFRAPSSIPGSVTGVLALGTDASTRAAIVIIASTGKLRAESTTSHTADSASGVCDGRDIPFLFVVDRTNNAVTLYTDTDKLTPTFGSTMTGKGIQILAESALNAAIITFEYEADWSGADAEWTSADAKKLLQWATGETITAW